MGQVQTGTICPFPYTFNRTTIEKIKNGELNENELSAQEDCSMTYAEFLSSSYKALQYTMMFFSLFILLLFCTRMHGLRKYAELVAKKQIIELAQFKFFVIGITGPLLLFIESIDLFGFSHRLPKEIYFLCDEILVVTLYVLVVLLVDFWGMLALSVKIGSATGIPVREKALFISIITFNYLGCITIGMSLPDKYFLLEGIKTFTGGILLFIFLARATQFVLKIQETLLTTIGSSDQSSSGMNHKRFETTRKAISTLRRKFSMFSVCVLLAAAIQIFNAISVWGLLNDTNNPVELQWKYEIEKQIDPAQLFIKILFLLIFITLAHFFTVPRSEVAVKAEKSALVSSSNEVGVNNKITNAKLQIESTVGITKDSEPTITGRDFSYSMPEAGERRPSFTMSTKLISNQPRKSDFKSMLQNNERRKEFAKFVSGRYASESVRFYEVASRYEAITDPVERQELGKEIIKNHFIDNAPYPITLKDSMRKNILQEEEFGPDTFKAALQETIDLLNNNFYQPFATYQRAAKQ